MSAKFTYQDIRTGPRAVLLLGILIAAGLAGNHFPVSILNAHFIFGSIFAMLALQVLGWGRGVMAAAVISAYTYFTWNHPWAFFTMTGETAVVGWLFSRRRVSLVSADALYWVILGIPAGFFCLHGFCGLPVDSSLFLVIKQAINGMANALAARLVFTVFAPPLQAERISLRETLANLLVLFVSVASLTLVIQDMRSDLAETDRNIRLLLVENSRNVTEGLRDWLAQREAAVVHLAHLAETLNPSEMQARLEQACASDPGFLRMCLLDRDGIAVAYSPTVDELRRPTIGKSFADRPYLPLLRQNLKPMLSEVMPSRFSHTGSVVILLAPVLVDGAYNGAVGGIMDFERIQKILETFSRGGQLQYTLVDRNGCVILTNRGDQEVMKPFSRERGSFGSPSGLHGKSLPAVIRGKTPLSDTEGEIQQWIPQLPAGASTIDLWGKSLYVAESAVGRLSEWRLILEQPVAPFQKRLHEEYAEKLFVLFAVLIVALVAAAWLSRPTVAGIEKLGLATRELPARISAGEAVTWPESRILETHRLIANVIETADSLREKFSEIREINATLEQRVADQTEALRQSEASLRHVLENIPAMIFMKEAESLRFVLFNRAGEELLGINRDELLGRNDYDFFPREEADFFTEKDRETLSGGRVIDIPEEPIQTRQRGVRILHTRKIPLYDAAGRPRFLLGVSIDITESKRSYEALQEANRKLQENQSETLSILEDLKAEVRVRQEKEAELKRVTMAIEQAGEVVVVTDPEGTIQYVNPAFTAVTGYSREEAIGRNPRLLQSGRQDRGFYRDLWETICSGRVWKGRLVNRRKDGQLYTEEATISPVRDDAGRIVNFVAVKRDISEHLRAEGEKAKLREQLQQAQRLESIGRLAGGVAHDFNNMLGIILGYGEIVLDKLHAEDPLRENVRQIIDAAHRSSTLVRQLLAFSRKQTLQPIPLDLNGLIRDLEKMVRRLIGEDIELELALPGDIGRVLADPGQIEQVILNLAVNARDAMPRGGRLLIETADVELDDTFAAKHPGVQPGSYVQLTVTDTGCGMDEEVLKRIFDPFFTTKEKGRGTGLGLSTVHGIVKQSGGSIWVYSEPGRGTTFKIYLPQTDVQPAPAAGQPLGGLSVGGGEHILVVEDEKSLRSLIEDLLLRLGYTVTTAADGGEALVLVEEKGLKPDMVITDVIMPHMNGKELIERLRVKYPHLKVLYMSGYTDNAIVHHGVLDPGTPFIQKPFTLRQLGQKVQDVLRGGM